FSLRAYDEKGNVLEIPSAQAVWQAEEVIGTISQDGLLTVPQSIEGLKYGYVEVEYNGVFAKALAVVGNKISEVIEDFETLELGGKAILSTGTITQPNSSPATASVQLVKRPEAIYGEHSAKFTYDMTGTTGTTATYLSLRDIVTGDLDRPIAGKPTKIGVWVYGNQNNHWLRIRLRNKEGKMFPVDLTTATSFNWTGWRYVTADIPREQNGPFKIMDIYIVETKDTNKDSGFVYYDRLSVFYVDTDVFGVDILGLTPMKVGETRKAKVAVTRKNSAFPEIINDKVTYLSSNPCVASVDSDGNVTALHPGRTKIVALYPNAEPGSFELVVTEGDPVVETVEIYCPEKIERGATGSLQVFAKFKGQDQKIEVTGEVEFVVQDPTIVRVNQDGIIQTMAEGETTIIAKYKGAEAFCTVVVIKPIPVLSKIELTGLKAANVTTEFQVKVIGVYKTLGEEDQRIELKEGTTFKSSNPNVAQIDQNGVVMAKSVGVTVIWATYSGKTANQVLVVNRETGAPKREFRAAWIATVENIDWPNKDVYDPEQQKQHFVEILDQLKEIGINAVIVQIRPTADSFYPS
ncbi:MAG: Ig-like domain-containing protein, partial [Pseudothermotoga sp.]